MIFDGNLDVQVTRERRDYSQDTQELVDVLIEWDGPEPFGLAAEHAPDHRRSDHPGGTHQVGQLLLPGAILGAEGARIAVKAQHAQLDRESQTDSMLFD